MYKLTSAFTLAVMTLSLVPAAVFAQNPLGVSTAPTSGCTSTGLSANSQNFVPIEFGLDVQSKGVYLTLSHNAIETGQFIDGFKLLVNGVSVPVAYAQVYGTSVSAPVEVIVAPKLNSPVLKETDTLVLSYTPKSGAARIESAINPGQMLEAFGPVTIVNGTVNDRTAPCLQNVITKVSGNTYTGYFNERLATNYAGLSIPKLTVNTVDKPYFMTSLSSQFATIVYNDTVNGSPLSIAPTTQALRMFIDGTTTIKDLRGNKAAVTPAGGQRLYQYGVNNYIEPVIQPTPATTNDPNGVPEVLAFYSTSPSGNYKTGSVIELVAETNMSLKSGSGAFVMTNNGKLIAMTPDGTKSRLIGKFTVGASDKVSELKISRGLYRVINASGSKTTQKMMSSESEVPGNFVTNKISINQ